MNNILPFVVGVPLALIILIAFISLWFTRDKNGPPYGIPYD